VSVRPGHSCAGSGRLSAWCFQSMLALTPHPLRAAFGNANLRTRRVLLDRITPQCSANALGGPQKRATRPKLALGAGCWSSCGSVEGAGGPFESESETCGHWTERLCLCCCPQARDGFAVLFRPEPIHFQEAILIAVLGLAMGFGTELVAGNGSRQRVARTASQVEMPHIGSCHRCRPA
jgi:hypothetical protein